jgi:hypothetical protein
VLGNHPFPRNKEHAGRSLTHSLSISQAVAPVALWHRVHHRAILCAKRLFARRYRAMLRAIRITIGRVQRRLAGLDSASGACALARGTRARSASRIYGLENPVFPCACGMCMVRIKCLKLAGNQKKEGSGFAQQLGRDPRSPGSRLALRACFVLM